MRSNLVAATILTKVITPLFLPKCGNFNTASACTIHNTQSGICTNKYLPSTYSSSNDGGKVMDLDAIEKAKVQWQSDMPFCGRWIASYYSPCVPSKPTSAWAEADANFPFGRLTDDDGKEDIRSIRTKDKWVEETVNSSIESRIQLEREKGKKHYRFYKNKDCQEAYARYTCWMNFPRCDEFEESLPMCQSACENMFRVCGFEVDLWRCEENIVDDGENGRRFFPGQPFQRNEFNPKSNDPKAVCTPSIKGSATTQFDTVWVASLVIIAAVINVAFIC